MDSIFDSDNYTTLHYNPSTNQENRLWIRYGDNTFEPVRRDGNLNRKYRDRTRPTDGWVTERPRGWDPTEHGFDVSLNHDFGEQDKPGGGKQAGDALFRRGEKGKISDLKYRGKGDWEKKMRPFAQKADNATGAPADRRTILAQGGEAEEQRAQNPTGNTENSDELKDLLDEKRFSWGGEGRSLWDGPRYGNWCGKNYSGGKTGDEPPIDSSDRACMQHDHGWDECDKLPDGEKGICKGEENKKLVQRLESLSDEPIEWPYPPPRALRNDAKASRKAAIWWFKR